MIQRNDKAATGDFFFERVDGTVVSKYSRQKIDYDLADKSDDGLLESEEQICMSQLRLNIYLNLAVMCLALVCITVPAWVSIPHSQSQILKVHVLVYRDDNGMRFLGTLD